MDIALMNEKVVFQKCSVVVDRIGNRRNEWTDEYCCFATIGGEGLASSREAETAGTVVEDVSSSAGDKSAKSSFRSERAGVLRNAGETDKSLGMKGQVGTNGHCFDE